MIADFSLVHRELVEKQSSYMVSAGFISISGPNRLYFIDISYLPYAICLQSMHVYVYIECVCVCIYIYIYICMYVCIH